MKPEEIIEISDPDLNVDEIMACIRQRLAARQQQAEARGLDYARLVDGVGPGPAGSAAPELYGDLRQLEQIADGLRVSPVITDWRLPLINGLVNRLKAMLHEMTLLYVNMLAARQIGVNRIVTQVLSSLYQTQQAQQTRLDALEREVALLRERLDQQPAAR